VAEARFDVGGGAAVGLQNAEAVVRELLHVRRFCSAATQALRVGQGLAVRERLHAACQGERYLQLLAQCWDGAAGAGGGGGAE
jgi:hypothetical protein